MPCWRVVDGARQARRQRLRRPRRDANACGANSGTWRPISRFSRPSTASAWSRLRASGAGARHQAGLVADRRRPVPPAPAAPAATPAPLRTGPALQLTVARRPRSGRSDERGEPVPACQPRGALGLRARAADEGAQVDLGQHALLAPASGWSRGRPLRRGARTPRAAPAAARASRPASARRRARRRSTMRASTCGRSTSWASSSSRPFERGPCASAGR